MTETTASRQGGICCCGYNCGRCPVYLATAAADPVCAAAYRKKAHDFYRDTLHMEIPEDKLVCLGGHSDVVMEVCLGCPFRQCCRDRHIERCKDCREYPCAGIAAYEKQWGMADQK